MLSGGSIRNLVRSIKLCSPVVFWAFTAAPSFVPAHEGSFEVARYTEKQESSTASSTLATQLFNREGYRPVIDSAVEQIYLALVNNKISEALRLTDRLLTEFPNFHVAHMLRGDILSIKAGREIKGIGDIPNAPASKKEDLADLRAEAIARLKAVSDRPSRDLLPSELVELDSDQAYVILVDASRSRLFLYENAFPYPRLVTDFYITQGRLGAVKSKEGDKRTPIGVYTITELLPKEKLSDFYGPMALPINYPNTWDQRQGKTGFGIWLHGMPKQLASRPPKASDGCVVLANQDILALKQYVKVGNTQVVISPRLNFVPHDTWQAERKTAIRMVKEWRDDLEQGLTSLSKLHYANDALIDGLSLNEWQQSKNLDQRSFGRIRVDDVTVIKYPDDKEDMMLVSFKQSDDISGEVRKQQYWMKVGTHWQIVQEETNKL